MTIYINDLKRWHHLIYFMNINKSVKTPKQTVSVVSCLRCFVSLTS